MEIANLIIEIFKTISELMVNLFKYIKEQKPKLDISVKKVWLDNDNFFAELEVTNTSNQCIKSLDFFMDYYYDRSCINYFTCSFECSSYATISAKIKIPKYKCFGEKIIYAVIITEQRYVYIQEYCVAGDKCLKWNEDFCLRKNGKMYKKYRKALNKQHIQQ